MAASQRRLLQNIFRSYKPALDKQRLPLHQLKAIDAITGCRRGDFGSSYYQCPNDQSIHEQQHSCRHRSCYQCSCAERQRWIEKQKSRLLNCPHFHVVFTLPSEYRVLWQYNTRWFTQTLFSVVQETLLTLMRDKRYAGVTPGLLLNLHTWGRQLNLHPHIHGLITAGGLDHEGQWQSTGEFLLPIALLKRLYRGKLQAQFKQALVSGELQRPPNMRVAEVLRLHRQAYQKPWSVRVEKQYRHGQGVVLYLSRYLKGGPIHPAQISRCDTQGIGFRYKDHRDQRSKLLVLEPLLFIRRLLRHVPVKGVHTVRYYGLYAGACRAKRNQCRSQWGDLSALENAGKSVKDAVALVCRYCGTALRLRYRRSGLDRLKGNSIIKHVATTPFVQQDDEPLITNVLRWQSPCYSSG